MHLCSYQTHASCSFPALVITSQANTFDQSTCIKYHIRLAQHHQQNNNPYVTIHHRSHRSKSWISCMQNWNETLILILESLLSFYLCLFSMYSGSIATAGHRPVPSSQPCVSTHSMICTITIYTICAQCDLYTCIQYEMSIASPAWHIPHPHVSIMPNISSIIQITFKQL